MTSKYMKVATIEIDILLHLESNQIQVGCPKCMVCTNNIEMMMMHVLEHSNLDVSKFRNTESGWVKDGK